MRRKTVHILPADRDHFAIGQIEHKPLYYGINERRLEIHVQNVQIQHSILRCSDFVYLSLSLRGYYIKYGTARIIRIS